MEHYDLCKMEKKLKKAVDSDRFHHTLGVMFTAASLAMVWDVDLTKARVAGLLHDCAKCISNEKKIEMCRKNKISVSKFEIENPFLLHAKLGAYLAEKKYDVNDPEILGAITWHTTGKPDMSMLEKIIYVADYIEPARYKAPNLALVRKLAFSDIDECVYQILKDSVDYLAANPKTMDVTTVEAYQYYKNLHYCRKEADCKVMANDGRE